MQFPACLYLGAWQIHPDILYESLAYLIALRLVLRNIRRNPISSTQRSSFFKMMPNSVLDQQNETLRRQIFQLFSRTISQVCGGHT